MPTCSEKELFLASYFCELTLINVRMYKYLPSQIAGAALYLACKMCRPTKQIWSKTMEEVCLMSEFDVLECAKDISHLINLAQRAKVYQPLYRKYSASAYQ